MKRIIYTIVAAASILASGVAAAAPAMASSAPAGQVVAHTHENGVTDTTNGGLSGTYCQVDPLYGPVWAHDNLERTVTATPTAQAGVWQVTVASNGSYAAFADPRTCGAPVAAGGPVKGQITFTVDATAAPSAANLGPQSDSTVRSSQLATALWLPGQAQIDPSAPQPYSFTYKLGGQDYTQTG